MTSRNIFLYRLLLTGAIASISYLAFTNREIPVGEDMNDKASHLLAFFVLALLVDRSWPMSSFGMVKAPALLGYGLFIEVVQYFLPFRTFSLLDLAADGIGILLFLAFAPFLRRLLLLAGGSRF